MIFEKQIRTWICFLGKYVMYNAIFRLLDPATSIRLSLVYRFMRTYFWLLNWFLCVLFKKHFRKLLLDHPLDIDPEYPFICGVFLKLVIFEVRVHHNSKSTGPIVLKFCTVLLHIIHQVSLEDFLFFNNYQFYNNKLGDFFLAKIGF